MEAAREVARWRPGSLGFNIMWASMQETLTLLLAYNKGQTSISQKDQKLFFKTNYRLMQVKSIAECFEHSAILLTFIKLPFVIKIFVLSIFEWPFYTGFTVHSCGDMVNMVNEFMQKKKQLQKA